LPPRATARYAQILDSALDECNAAGVRISFELLSSQGARQPRRLGALNELICAANGLPSPIGKRSGEHSLVVPPSWCREWRIRRYFERGGHGAQEVDVPQFDMDQPRCDTTIRLLLATSLPGGHRTVQEATDDHAHKPEYRGRPTGPGSIAGDVPGESGSSGANVTATVARRSQLPWHRAQPEVTVKDEDGIDLADGDFRRVRRYLAPWLFADGEEGTTYPPPSDLMQEEPWDSVMALPTDVALKTSSYSGAAAARLEALHHDWVFSWPDPGAATFMDEICLLAGEEVDALVFNAIHGYYRQAIGCLRNALETMTIAAGLAVTNNVTLFGRWRAGQEISFGQARSWIRGSAEGAQIDREVAPHSVFGNVDTSWIKDRYSRLCAYAHSQAGYNNADFWESNGPVYRPQALMVVEAEMRETLAIAYLLLRLGRPTYAPAQGPANLLQGPQGSWSRFGDLLQRWLL
jgi:hypothetical protein